MVYYKVELVRSFDTSSSVIKTYEFLDEKSAKDFMEEGNQILVNSRAFDCGLYGPEELEVNIVENVDKELNQLKQEFKDYRY